ncbi:hypothetical protein HID58_007617 [Brassica napus]|uniref:Uncharacterized protein n=1 Tax=Brassica napus TaxID=3708 RepID=A0ABQ8EEN4_BRANA|nr:hypothetical protein HID58_007617 [Brassica napus]
MSRCTKCNGRFIQKPLTIEEAIEAAKVHDCHQLYWEVKSQSLTLLLSCHVQKFMDSQLILYMLVGCSKYIALGMPENVLQLIDRSLEKQEEVSLEDNEAESLTGTLAWSEKELSSQSGTLSNYSYGVQSSLSSVSKKKIQVLRDSLCHVLGNTKVSQTPEEEDS